MKVPHIKLAPCPKGYSLDLDKAISPEQTVSKVNARLANINLDIVAEVRRIDTGRLGIPVYLSVCGADARQIMPTRKQMGKGSSPAQAHASALMELMERYAFFSFWQDRRHMLQATWKEAENLFGDALLPVRQIALSVFDTLPDSVLRELLDLVPWQFYPATRLSDGKIVWLPLDWFRLLGEFNGSSAGNTAEESLLQGLCELVERHVSCIVATKKPELATISPQSCTDSVLRKLLDSFKDKNINLVLKDISLGMPLPTVAALAWDPSTFPQKSEIVLTAGTASSPTRAAIRAVTEVAQLAGDFCSGACYEASGLPKFTSVEDCHWLLAGPQIDLSALPSVENPDICQELLTAVKELAPLEVYAVETTNPLLNVPAHYCIVPGLDFLERDRNQSVGLFVGRKLAEELEPAQAARGLAKLGQLCPNAPYLPFYRGLLALRTGELEKAWQLFLEAAPLQPDAPARAMAIFYAAYAKTQNDDWQGALPLLTEACELNPLVKEYANLCGVALFKKGDYAAAEKYFDKALKIDRGSAMDLANRGLCRKFQGKLEAAALDLSAALELDPGIDFAFKHLAEIEASLKK